jgi:hypothetical protein
MITNIKQFFMLAKNEVAKIYETLLSIPGMNDSVKIPLSISRKNVLLLCKVIERGLLVKETDEKVLALPEIISKEVLQELQALPKELLEKAGLTEMHQKLQSF